MVRKENSQKATNETSEQHSILVGPPKLTRFETARIVGARALQISMGAPVLIIPPEGTTNLMELAIQELKSGVLPITVRRTLPDGTYQDIPLQWLTPSIE